METLIVEPKSKKQLDAIKAVLKAMEISFRKADESPYNPEFVDKIKRAEKNVKDGNFVEMGLDELRELCG